MKKRFLFSAFITSSIFAYADNSKKVGIEQNVQLEMNPFAGNFEIYVESLWKIFIGKLSPLFLLSI